MGRYVESIVVPVPKGKLDIYQGLAETSGKIWREHGALEYFECLADDVKPGEVTSFPKSVQLKADETVAIAYIVYESREQRDRINDKVMKDPRMKDLMDPKKMPFDGKRMFYGGFNVIVNA